MCVCVCVCVCINTYRSFGKLGDELADIVAFMAPQVCVCVFVCVFV